MPSTSGSIAFAWRNARATPCTPPRRCGGITPTEHRDVHRETAVEGDRLERVPHERTREVAADEVVLVTRGLARVDEVRTTADVDHGLRERLVEGDEGVAVARDPGLVAERLPDRLTEHDRDVLHGVVRVDVRVAGGADGEIGERVLRERGQEVVEERHRRVDVARTRTVQIEVELDGGLARDPTEDAVR
jgi:hypothetical protein